LIYFIRTIEFSKLFLLIIIYAFSIDFDSISVAVNFQPNFFTPIKGYIRLAPVPISIPLIDSDSNIISLIH